MQQASYAPIAAFSRLQHHQLGEVAHMCPSFVRGALGQLEVVSQQKGKPHGLQAQLQRLVCGDGDGAHAHTAASAAPLSRRS